MTAPTTTAATPEELARTADLRASLDRAYAIASPTGAANHLAAWANNHGKALLDLAEAQRAEIERLTKERDEAREGEQEEIASAEAALSQAEKDAAALHVACHDRDEWKARATTAEAALVAVTAGRDRMREALQGVIGMAENFLELHMMSSAKKDPDIIRARAALSAKEASDVR